MGSFFKTNSVFDAYKTKKNLEGFGVTTPTVDTKIKSLEQDLAQNNVKTPPIVKRNPVDRIFDVLSVGLYPVMGALKNATDTDASTTVGKGITEGLKAANPFGQGYEKGEATFTDVLNNVGYKYTTNEQGNPEFNKENVVRFLASLGGDVFLDPITYASLGVAPLLRGVGKSAAKTTAKQIAKKSMEEVMQTPEFHKGVAKALTDSGLDASMSDSLIAGVKRAAKVEDLKYKQGLGWYGENVPFSKQLGIDKLKLELVKPETLQKIGDATVGKYFNAGIEKLADTPIGQGLSKTIDPMRKFFNSDMSLASKETARQNPLLWISDKAHEIKTNRLGNDLLKRQAAHIQETEDLFTINGKIMSPKLQKEMSNVYEQTDAWNRIDEMVKTGNISVEESVESKQYFDKLSEYRDEIARLRDAYTNIQGFEEDVNKLELLLEKANKIMDSSSSRYSYIVQNAPILKEALRGRPERTANNFLNQFVNSDLTTIEQTLIMNKFVHPNYAKEAAIEIRAVLDRSYQGLDPDTRPIYRGQQLVEKAQRDKTGQFFTEDITPVSGKQLPKGKSYEMTKERSELMYLLAKEQQKMMNRAKRELGDNIDDFDFDPDAFKKILSNTRKKFANYDDTRLKNALQSMKENATGMRKEPNRSKWMDDLGDSKVQTRYAGAVFEKNIDYDAKLDELVRQFKLLQKYDPQMSVHNYDIYEQYGFKANIGPTLGSPRREFQFNNMLKKANVSKEEFDDYFRKFGDKVETVAQPKGNTYTWDKNVGYEVSSKGDKRFSAFYAKLKDGRTIEEAYQLDVKGYRKFSNDAMFGKGKPPLDTNVNTWQEYLNLWRTWAEENPKLIKELSQHHKLSDRFATTEVNQAHALSVILNEQASKRAPKPYINVENEIEDAHRLESLGATFKTDPTLPASQPLDDIEGLAKQLETSRPTTISDINQQKQEPSFFKKQNTDIGLEQYDTVLYPEDDIVPYDLGLDNLSKTKPVVKQIDEVIADKPIVEPIVEKIPEKPASTMPSKPSEIPPSTNVPVPHAIYNLNGVQLLEELDGPQIVTPKIIMDSVKYIYMKNKQLGRLISDLGTIRLANVTTDVKATFDQSKKVIKIFNFDDPDVANKVITQIFPHELAHLLALPEHGLNMNVWKKAMELDAKAGRKGTLNVDEDFAQSLAYFLRNQREFTSRFTNRADVMEKFITNFKLDDKVINKAIKNFQIAKDLIVPERAVETIQKNLDGALEKFTDALNVIETGNLSVEQADTVLNKIKMLLEDKDKAFSGAYPEKPRYTIIEEEVLKTTRELNLDKVLIDSNEIDPQEYKNIADRVASMFQRWGLEEEISDMMFAYLPHMKKMLKNGEKLDIYTIKDNVFNRTREMEGTVEEINRRMKPYTGEDDFFENMLSRIVLERGLEHNKIMFDKEFVSNLVTMFGSKLKDVSNLPPGKTAYVSSQDVLNSLRRVNVQTKPIYMKITKATDEAKKATGIGFDIYRYIDTNQLYMDTPEEILEYLRKNEPDFGSVQAINYAFPEFSLFKEAVESAQKTLQENGSSLYKQQRDNFIKLVDDLKLPEELYKSDMFMKPITKIDADTLARLKAINKDIDAFTLPDLTAARVERQGYIQERDMRWALTKFYDKFLRLIKNNQTTINPGFHGRNAISNQYLSYLNIGSETFNVDNHKKAVTLLRHDAESLADNTDFVTTKNGKQILLKDIAQMLVDYNVVKPGRFAGETMDFTTGAPAAEVMKKALKIDQKGSFNPLNSEKFVGYRAGRKVGSTVEDEARIVNFIGGLKLGFDPLESSERVNKYMFDYQDLSTSETQIMRRMIPYYTWMRKNIPLQLETLLQDPKVMRNINKLFISVEGITPSNRRVQDEDMNEFAREWIQLPFTVQGASGKQEPTFFNPNMPFGDLNKVNPFHPEEMVRDAFTSMSPILKTPIETLANKNVYFNSPISRGIGDTDDVPGYLQLNRLTTPDNVKYKAPQMNPYGRYALKQLGFPENISKIIEASGEGKDGQLSDKTLATLGFLTGLKTYSYDVGKYREWAMRDRLKTLQDIKNKSEKD